MISFCFLISLKIKTKTPEAYFMLIEPGNIVVSENQINLIPGFLILENTVGQIKASIEGREDRNI